MKCKRCGQKISSPLSIKRGYGAVCYARALRNGEVSEKKTGNNDIQDLKDKWSQLSLKCSILEKKIKKIMESGVRIQSNVEAIERIERNNERPERNELKVHFGAIVRELKNIFEKGVELEKVPENQMNHMSIYKK